ncbi:hypothetical protein CRUP_037249 [Coryphaenoides rupestris]|nr:hypothetical protein CRUP_037249 [Coryphaenoides rupestris]
MDNPSLWDLLPPILRSKRDILFGNMPEIYNFHSRVKSCFQNMEICKRRVNMYDTVNQSKTPFITHVAPSTSTNLTMTFNNQLNTVHSQVRRCGGRVRGHASAGCGARGCYAPCGAAGAAGRSVGAGWRGVRGRRGPAVSAAARGGGRI